MKPGGRELERGPVSCNMATESNNTFRDSHIFDKIDKSEMNKLRDCGLEYVSTSGKIVPARTQPEIYCHCPQQCQSKLPREKWKDLFQQFYRLADQNKQNTFLQTHIHIKRLHIYNEESKDKPIPPHKRRVTCKYHVPVLDHGETLETYLEKVSPNSQEVCQKAFMNVFGITEKRVRMQREKSIALMAPDYYPRLPEKKSKPPPELIPIELMPKEIKKRNHDDMEYCDQPLDLRKPAEKSPSPVSIPIEIDKSKLYELAEMLGIPKSTVDREMVDKYADLVRKNLAKQQKALQLNNKCKRKAEAPKTTPKIKGISEQVVGLQENLPILPMQTVNNGDLTITPILGPEPRPVQNQDIMQVNNFFQNQLWSPELIGLKGFKTDVPK